MNSSSLINPDSILAKFEETSDDFIEKWDLSSSLWYTDLIYVNSISRVPMIGRNCDSRCRPTNSGRSLKGEYTYISLSDLKLLNFLLPKPLSNQLSYIHCQIRCCCFESTLAIEMKIC